MFTVVILLLYPLVVICIMLLMFVLIHLKKITLQFFYQNQQESEENPKEAKTSLTQRAEGHPSQRKVFGTFRFWLRSCAIFWLKTLNKFAKSTSILRVLLQILVQYLILAENFS